MNKIKGKINKIGENARWPFICKTKIGNTPVLECNTWNETPTQEIRLWG